MFELTGQNPPIVKASMGEGIINLFRWIGEQIRNIPDYVEWFRKWRLSHPTVGPEHRLPDNFRPYDVSRGSPISRGLRQTLINAGTKPEVAEHILRRIEAEAASDKQIARIGTTLVRITRALNQAAQAGPPTGTPGSGAAAGGVDVVFPDLTQINDRIGLAMESNYQNAVDRWRTTQSLSRHGSTLGQPKTAQDVDALIRDLQSAQRARKSSLGIDVKRLAHDTAYQKQCAPLMRGDAEMNQLWQEQAALVDLRTQCADLNVIRRATGRR